MSRDPVLRGNFVACDHGREGTETQAQQPSIVTSTEPTVVPEEHRGLLAKLVPAVLGLAVTVVTILWIAFICWGVLTIWTILW
jgi:hypothetical protein